MGTVIEFGAVCKCADCDVIESLKTQSERADFAIDRKKNRYLACIYPWKRSATVIPRRGNLNRLVPDSVNWPGSSEDLCSKKNGGEGLLGIRTYKAGRYAGSKTFDFSNGTVVYNKGGLPDMANSLSNACTKACKECQDTGNDCDCKN